MRVLFACLMIICGVLLYQIWVLSGQAVGQGPQQKESINAEKPGRPATVSERHRPDSPRTWWRPTDPDKRNLQAWWKTTHPDKPVRLAKALERPITSRPQMIERKLTMVAPPDPHILTMPPPTTIDDYVIYVRDRLQLETMKLNRADVAEVKLTIGKDGTVWQANVRKLEAPAALRVELSSLVNQMSKLPPLPDDADVLVLTLTLALNYPSPGLYDRFG
jgi:hypothetical protein